MNLFSGRINRKNYLLGLLFAVASFTCLSILTILLGSLFLSPDNITIALIPLYLALIPFGIFVWSLHMRRLHDRGHGGWWILIFYIDIWLNLFVKGNEGVNKYGEPPSKEANFFKAILGRE